MKKLVSIILIFVLMMSMNVVPVFAYENLISGDYLYESKYVEEYIEPVYNYEEDWYTYSEKYYHHIDETDPESEIDWVLVAAGTNMAAPWFAKMVVKDIVFNNRGSGGYPFEFYYAVYDVKEEAFVEITDSMVDDYDGLYEMMLELNVGTPIGDANKDNKLSVMDATYIQRVLAGLCDFDEDDDISGHYNLGSENLDYVSDFDRDGERTIFDATAIQMKLAEIEEKPNIMKIWFIQP
ncbi:MAG: dockerin type I repeat-containing protein [Ruminococcus sp.]|nr:dockerin type I repeat-containing protein [Ruminococcus sp.]